MKLPISSERLFEISEGNDSLSNWSAKNIHVGKVSVANLPIVNQSTIDSEGFKGGTRGAPIMPRDAVSRTANVERTGGH